MEVIIFTLFMIFIVIRIIIQTNKNVNSKTTNVPGRVDRRVPVNSQANNSAMPSRQLTKAVKVSGINSELRGGTAGSSEVVNQRSRTTLAALSATMENRGNDWLARQLSEERIVKKKMSDMFDLKQQHAADCDAEYNKMAHANNCDANGVDRARG